MNLSNKQRIVISAFCFVLLTGLAAFSAINNNSTHYIAHPVAYMMGASIPPILASLACYWLLGIKRKTTRRNRGILKTRTANNGKKDDWAYEQAARELDSDSRELAVWARAYAESNGDEAATKAKYIARRVERLLALKSSEEQLEIDNQPEPSESIQARKNLKRTGIVFGVLIACAVGYIYFKGESKNNNLVVPNTARSIQSQDAGNAASRSQAEEHTSLPIKSHNCAEQFEWMQVEKRPDIYRETSDFLKSKECNILTKYKSIKSDKYNNIRGAMQSNSYWSGTSKSQRMEMVEQALNTDEAFNQLQSESQELILYLLGIAKNSPDHIEIPPGFRPD